MAAAHAAAQEQSLPLYQYLGDGNYRCRCR
jgi:enolase